MKNVLLLIPSVLKTGLDAAVAADRHPRMDYYALADGLRATGATVTLVGYAEAEADRRALVRLARKAGRDAALAMIGFLDARRYDAVFTNGENVGIPLALLLKTVRRRPGHVCIGHKPSTGKKRLFFRTLHADRQIDTLFVYARTQLDFAREQLAISPDRLRLIHFHADARFYRPMRDVSVNPHQISAAGLEWRDYPTLIAAVESTPDLQVRLAAASPWSKHSNETENRALPANVDARRYEYNELRTLYASSAFVVVPLYENDFQAGITSMLEAMAIGKAIVVTATTGQRDVVVDGENGLTVAAGDVKGWRTAIARLQSDTDLRDRLGVNARQWIEKNATLEVWVDHIVSALRESATRSLAPSGVRDTIQQL